MSFVHLLHPTYVKRRGFWNYSISVTNEPLPFTAEDHIKFAGMYLTPVKARRSLKGQGH